MSGGKYRLWVGVYQEIPETIEFSYYDSRRRYLFILSDRKPEGRFKPVTTELLGELSPGERAWFNDSCMKLNSRWLKEHETEAREKVDAFLDQFEEELKREAERAKDGGRTDPQGCISGGD